MNSITDSGYGGVRLIVKKGSLEGHSSWRVNAAGFHGAWNMTLGFKTVRKRELDIECADVIFNKNKNILILIKTLIKNLGWDNEIIAICCFYL